MKFTMQNFRLVSETVLVNRVIAYHLTVFIYGVSQYATGLQGLSL